MFASLAATNDSNDNIISNNAAASSSTANNSASAASNIAEGLQIKTNVNYFDGSSGYLVYPSSITGKKYPAVIMIHEWWGINDNIRSMANTFAKQGYVLLAVDLFKGQSAKEPNQALQLVRTVTTNPEQSISNLQAAVKYVSSLPFVDSSKIASIGWCFGGGQSLRLALHSQSHPLVATILYYTMELLWSQINKNTQR
jgi:carboxymethylenebutenolidase